MPNYQLHLQTACDCVTTRGRSEAASCFSPVGKTRHHTPIPRINLKDKPQEWYHNVNTNKNPILILTRVNE